MTSAVKKYNEYKMNIINQSAYYRIRPLFKRPSCLIK